jgi:hypothetical protein
VLSNVSGLSYLEPPEAILVAVNNLQSVTSLFYPKVQIGNVTSELVPVESNETRQLVGYKLR